ncbi:MAG TPA: hypothetical protein VFT45_05835 [Longimicrobium sp.]|nr:hypothetical protein [Longimicrobium sp.]
MNKLKLRLDELRVDSFQTTLPPAEKGTVIAQGVSYDPSCGVSCTTDSCEGATCPYTCAESCNGSCGPGTCFQTCEVFNTCYGMVC